MRPLSTADQDAAIRRLFPAFRQTCPFDFMGMWRGPLRPLARTYEIGIAYFPRVRFAGAVIANSWNHARGARPGDRPRPAGHRREAAAHLPESRNGRRLVALPVRPEDRGLG